MSGTLPPWFREWPDATTEAIIRIDQEISETKAWQERINREATCLTCGQGGIHTHFRHEVMS